MAGAQRALIDVELVRIHRALYHRLPKAIRRSDEDDVAETGVGIEGEHDAARAQVGADHVLDARRQGDLVVLEALMHAIGDCTVVEQRSEHFVHALQQRVATAHVEERFLLTGERGIRQVLGRRGGTHRHGDLAAAAHALERFQDLAFQSRRERSGENPLTDACADHRQLLYVFDIERRQLLGDARSETLVLQEIAIRLRRRCEAVGHCDPGIREVTDHLAERGVLAADSIDVVTAELGEGNGVAQAGARVGAHVWMLRVAALDPGAGQVRQSGDG